MFAEKQRIKQRLIDNATRNLMNQMAADETALEEQVEAMRKQPARGSRIEQICCTGENLSLEILLAI